MIARLLTIVQIASILALLYANLEAKKYGSTIMITFGNPNPFPASDLVQP